MLKLPTISLDELKDHAAKGHKIYSMSLYEREQTAPEDRKARKYVFVGKGPKDPAARPYVIHPIGCKCIRCK